VQVVEQVGKSHSDADPVAAFRIRKVKYGGYAVLVEDAPGMPHRHVCDFRSEYEARAWIAEHAAAHTQAPPEH
jgi:hypothetical protein